MIILTDLKVIKDLICTDGVFEKATGETRKQDYTPNPNGIYFKQKHGVVWYEPRWDGVLEMVSACTKMPQPVVQVVNEQWKYLADQGYRVVFAHVKKQNLRSAVVCRVLGMSKHKGDDINIYTKVIHGIS